MAPVDEMLRFAVAFAVAGLLGRAVGPAWRYRALAFSVWRRIRFHHLVGCLLLLAAVLGTAVGLARVVPFTGWGLGTLIGLDGNAIFAPLQEAAELTAPRPGSETLVPAGPDWTFAGIAGGFLLLLLVLFPWLAYVEERAFRQGLEDASFGREVLAALRFGLVHLVMLIPIAAAIGISVAGFVYGRIYRRAHRRALGRPPSLVGWFGGREIIETPTRRARTEAVLHTTVWHTTFNSLIVLLVLFGVLYGTFAGP